MDFRVLDLAAMRYFFPIGGFQFYAPKRTPELRLVLTSFSELHGGLRLSMAAINATTYRM